MTRGEQLYADHRREEFTQKGNLLPSWCELPANVRLAWIMRGHSEHVAESLDDTGESCERTPTPS